MKYAVLISEIDSAYTTPLLSKRSNSLFAKLMKFFTKKNRLDSVSKSEADCNHETVIRFKPDNAEYTAKHFSPRIWRRHSALLSMIEDQKH